MADNDLLSFIRALDAAEDEAVGGMFPGVNDRSADDPKTRKAGKKKRVQLKPILQAPSAKLSLDDLDMSDGSEEGEEDKAKIKRARGSRKGPLEAPLAPALQRKVERQVAYEETKKDMSKWTGIVRENRSKDCLHFPNPQNVPRPPQRPLSDSFVPQNDFEKRYLELVGKDNGDGKAEPSGDHSLDSAFPFNEQALIKDVEAAEARAKKRSDAFFRDRKAAHQSRIKSKKYRKMLARERKKEALVAESSIPMTERLAKLHDPEEKRRRREERELARARERLTLKTRKANQWASEMLLKRASGDPISRQEILEQVKAKDILRREIMGGDDETEEESEGDIYDVAATEKLARDLRKVTGDISENEDVPVGRRRFGAAPTLEKPLPNNEHGIFVNEDIDNVEDGSSDGEKKADAATERAKRNSIKELLQDKMKQKLEKTATARSIFQPQAALRNEQINTIPDDFAKAKQMEIEQEEPKIQDVTLPGWGSWTGPAYKDVMDAGRVKTKVTKAIAGIAKSERRDARLAHVIITEKRVDRSAFEVPSIPFPFGSREEYERSLDVGGIGPEWNTQKSFLAKTRPRIKVQKGQIIDPIRVKSVTTNI